MSGIIDRRADAIRTRNKPPSPTAPYQPTAEKGQSGGYASLTETAGLVPTNQLATGTPAAGKALMGDQTWGDIATQVELDAEALARANADTSEATARATADTTEATARAGVQTNLNTHAALTTTAHGGIVASTDTRLTDARTPTAHHTTHQDGGSDEIATSTPGANVIPKAGAGSELALGFIPATLTGRTLVQSGAVTGVSVPNAAATALLTLPAVAGAVYLVAFQASGNSAPNGGFAVIGCGNGGSTFAVYSSGLGAGAFTTIAVTAGGVVQITQTSGGTLTNIVGSYLRLL